MGSDGPADSAGVDQPQAQGPPGRWTPLWAYPQVRENLSSRGGALASGTCRGGPARDSEGAEARGRRVALWGLKDLALLLGYRQVALVSSGGLRGWRRDTVPEPQSEQWWVGGEGGRDEKFQEAPPSATGGQVDMVGVAEPEMTKEADTGWRRGVRGLPARRCGPFSSPEHLQS